MQQMKREGVQPDIHTYTSFVNACCKAGDMQVCSSFITVYFPLHYRQRAFTRGSWKPIRQKTFYFNLSSVVHLLFLDT
jgi:hypothetical protein